MIDILDDIQFTDRYGLAPLYGLGLPARSDKR